MMSLVRILSFFSAISVSVSAHAITVAAVGDIMMGTNYPSAEGLVDLDFFKAVQPLLSSNDIRFGNLEGTLYDGPQNPDGKAPGPNRYAFRTPTEMVSHLKGASFNVMSLANNHAKDFGKKGIESTKRTLTSAGIQFSSKDGEVAAFNIQGTTVALIALDFKSGARSITNPETTYAEIQQLKQTYAIVIVSVHAGAEGFGAEHVYNRNEIFLGENRGNSVRFAHEAVDSGADLLLIHGPHVPRGLEVYQGRLIAYSLGNFMTGKGISLNGNAGLAPLLEVELDNSGALVQGQITSFLQVRGQGVKLDPKQRALTLIRELSESDFPSTRPEISAQGLLTPVASGGLR
jgi:poly-gamma-glutamate capsule biosynthesis protein CapA/YwtB (metallophosphatase superfamily)